MATKTVKAVVAPRRTVQVGGATFGPGAEVSIPTDEVANLRALGYLVNPAASISVEAGAGPVFGPDVNAVALGDEE